MSSLQWARRLSAVIGSAGVVAAFVVSGSWNWATSVGGVAWGLRVDRVSAVLLTLVGLLGWLVTTYALTNLRGQRRLGRFGLLAAGAIAALALMVTGASLPLVALGWTLSGLAIAALVGHAGTPGARRAAAHTRRRLLVGDALLWLGVLVGVVGLPTVDRADLGDAVATGSPSAAVVVVALCLVAAGLVRSALVPFHRWLPETAEAPSPVSAMLHAGVVNGAGILALVAWPLVSAVPAALLVLVVAGAASVVLGTLAAQLRGDVKGRLACSTTAQMGWMAVQLGLGLPAAALLHLVGHGCYKAWLFLRAGGAVTRSRRTRSSGSPASAIRDRGRIGAALAALVAVAGIAPAAVHQVGLLGAVAVLPPLLATAAATAAGRAAGRDPGPLASLAGAAAVAGACAAAYGWLLLIWEDLLAGSLPTVPVWDGAVAVALVAAVVVTGAVLVVVARRLRPTATSTLALRLGGTALPPWHARVGGRAGWPAPAAPGAAGAGGRAGEGAAPTGPALTPATVTALVRTAGTVVSPQWPLREMVTSNPLAQLETMPFDEAVQVAQRVHGAAGHLPLTTYHRLHETGRIARRDLAAVVADLTGGTAGRTALDVDLSVQQFLEASALEAAQETARETAQPAVQVTPGTGATPATGGTGATRLCEATDGSVPARLAGLVDDHAALWTQRAWSRADDDTVGPWRLWRAAAARPAHDRQVGVSGLSRLVRELPEDPATAIGTLLDRAGVPAAQLVGYVCRTLAAAPGWAAHAQWRVRRTEDLGPLLELVALRVALDVLYTGAVATGPVAPVTAPSTAPEPTLFAGRRIASVWQLAYERGIHDDLLARLQRRPEPPAAASGAASRPRAQLVLCIDVRSERFRRALEQQGPYETFGAAGFFGALVRYRDVDGATFDQCPALVTPAYDVTADASAPVRFRSRLHRAGTSLGSAPAVPLVVAEAGGLPAAAAALSATVLPRRWQSVDRAWTRRGRPGADRRRTPDRGLHVAMTEEERTDAAEGLLRSIGLVDGFAPLLVVSGHAASMENNAYASAYDCGACGGNGGEVNAVVVVDALNDAGVRRRLAARGIVLPEDTVAVAALHETTTDALLIDPSTGARSTHPAEVAALEADAGAAAAVACAERLRTLPAGVRGRRTARRDDACRTAARRASDWSEPTPEWGLAGNAAMVVGPRRLTADLDLAGRVFLQSYDERHDPDHAVLESLLNAPAVVGQWINAQYYFSTVAPDVLGAGDKTTHNVVGDVGVLTGAHGDLRLGLPWQALFAADPAVEPGPGAHEPVRQLVVVAAAPEAVLDVVRRSPVLQRLVCGEWMHLACVSSDHGGDTCAHLVTTDLRVVEWTAPLASPWTDPSADPVADALGPR